MYTIGPHLQVTETLSYIDGAREVTVAYAIKNVSAAAVTFRAAELADLDPGNDAGRSFLVDRDGSRVIGGWTPSGALVGLDENTPWTRYQSGPYGDVFEAFATSGLRDTVDPILEDNGVGAQWDVSGLGPGATAPLAVTWRIAADETVNTAADDGTGGCTTDPGGCTLREALGTASGGGDIVTVPENDYALPGGHLAIDHDLTVLGGGAPGTRIIGHRDSPSSGDRVIEVTNDATLDLRAVTLTNGQAGDGNGGAIHAVSGSNVAISDSTISGNEAWDGGGVDSAGTVTIERSTVSGNHALNNGGGLSMSGTGSLQNTTISGNSASSGGGVYVAANMSLASVTIADNTANPNLGGGLYEQVDTQTTSATNTLWARNTGGSCRGIQAVLSNYGLADDAQCFTRGGPGNLVRPAIALGPLAENDGDTWTQLPGAGSDAIDHGNPEACPATDQRGFPRPNGPFCDIGAVEGEGSPAQPGQARATLTIVTRVVNDNGGTRGPGDFTVRVRQGAADVSGSPKSGSATGAVYSLAAGTYAVSAAAPAGYATAIGGALRRVRLRHARARGVGDVHGHRQRSAAGGAQVGERRARKGHGHGPGPREQEVRRAQRASRFRSARSSTRARARHDRRRRERLGRHGDGEVLRRALQGRPDEGQDADHDADAGREAHRLQGEGQGDDRQEEGQEAAALG